MSRAALRRSMTTGALVVAALLAALEGCSDLKTEPLPTPYSDATDATVVNPTLEKDVQPIFSARCAIPGCHAIPTEANFWLVLSDAQKSRASLVNVHSGEEPEEIRVIPGDAASSILMEELDEEGGMPKTGPMLSQGARDTVRNWIDQGAP